MPKQINQLKQSETAKRTNLAEWRASRLHDLELPSGLSVTLRDVSMTDLMLTGELPESILSVAEDVSAKGQDNIDLKQIAKNGAEFGKMLNTVVKLSLVTPRLGDASDNEHITLDELTGDDKMAIFNFINREATALQPFREGEEQPVAVV